MMPLMPYNEFPTAAERAQRERARESERLQAERAKQVAQERQRRAAAQQRHRDANRAFLATLPLSGPRPRITQAQGATLVWQQGPTWFQKTPLHNRKLVGKHIKKIALHLRRLCDGANDQANDVAALHDLLGPNLYGLKDEHLFTLQQLFHRYETTQLQFYFYARMEWLLESYVLLALTQTLFGQSVDQSRLTEAMAQDTEHTTLYQHARREYQPLPLHLAVATAELDRHPTVFQAVFAFIRFYPMFYLHISPDSPAGQSPRIQLFTSLEERPRRGVDTPLPNLLDYLYQTHYREAQVDHSAMVLPPELADEVLALYRQQRQAVLDQTTELEQQWLAELKKACRQASHVTELLQPLSSQKEASAQVLADCRASISQLNATYRAKADTAIADFVAHQQHNDNGVEQQLAKEQACFFPLDALSSKQDANPNPLPALLWRYQSTPIPEKPQLLRIIQAIAARYTHLADAVAVIPMSLLQDWDIVAIFLQHRANQYTDADSLRQQALTYHQRRGGRMTRWRGHDAVALQVLARFVRWFHHHAPDQHRLAWTEQRAITVPQAIDNSLTGTSSTAVSPAGWLLSPSDIAQTRLTFRLGRSDLATVLHYQFIQPHQATRPSWQAGPLLAVDWYLFCDHLQARQSVKLDVAFFLPELNAGQWQRFCRIANMAQQQHLDMTGSGADRLTGTSWQSFTHLLQSQGLVAITLDDHRFSTQQWQQLGDGLSSQPELQALSVANNDLYHGDRWDAFCQMSQRLQQIRVLILRDNQLSQLNSDQLLQWGATLQVMTALITLDIRDNAWPSLFTDPDRTRAWLAALQQASSLRQLVVSLDYYETDAAWQAFCDAVANISQLHSLTIATLPSQTIPVLTRLKLLATTLKNERSSLQVTVRLTAAFIKALIPAGEEGGEEDDKRQKLDPADRITVLATLFTPQFFAALSSADWAAVISLIRSVDAVKAQAQFDFNFHFLSPGIRLFLDIATGQLHLQLVQDPAMLGNTGLLPAGLTWRTDQMLMALAQSHFFQTLSNQLVIHLDHPPSALGWEVITYLLEQKSEFVHVMHHERVAVSTLLTHHPAGPVDQHRQEPNTHTTEVITTNLLSQHASIRYFVNARLIWRFAVEDKLDLQQFNQPGDYPPVGLQLLTFALRQANHNRYRFILLTPQRQLKHILKEWAYHLFTRTAHTHYALTELLFFIEQGMLFPRHPALCQHIRHCLDQQLALDTQSTTASPTQQAFAKHAVTTAMTIIHLALSGDLTTMDYMRQKQAQVGLPVVTVLWARLAYQPESDQAIATNNAYALAQSLQQQPCDDNNDHQCDSAYWLRLAAILGHAPATAELHDMAKGDYDYPSYGRYLYETMPLFVMGGDPKTYQVMAMTLFHPRPGRFQHYRAYPYWHNQQYLRWLLADELVPNDSKWQLLLEIEKSGDHNMRALLADPFLREQYDALKETHGNWLGHFLNHQLVVPLRQRYALSLTHRSIKQDYQKKKNPADKVSYLTGLSPTDRQGLCYEAIADQLTAFCRSQTFLGQSLPMSGIGALSPTAALTIIENGIMSLLHQFQQLGDGTDQRSNSALANNILAQLHVIKTRLQQLSMPPTKVLSSSKIMFKFGLYRRLDTYYLIARMEEATEQIICLEKFEHKGESPKAHEVGWQKKIIDGVFIGAILVDSIASLTPYTSLALGALKGAGKFFMNLHEWYKHHHHTIETYEHLGHWMPNLIHISHFLHRFHGHDVHEKTNEVIRQTLHIYWVKLFTGVAANHAERIPYICTQYYHQLYEPIIATLTPESAFVFGDLLGALVFRSTMHHYMQSQLNPAENALTMPTDFAQLFFALDQLVWEFALVSHTENIQLIKKDGGLVSAFSILFPRHVIVQVNGQPLQVELTVSQSHAVVNADNTVATPARAANFYELSLIRQACQQFSSHADTIAVESTATTNLPAGIKAGFSITHVNNPELIAALLNAQEEEKTLSIELAPSLAQFVAELDCDLRTKLHQVNREQLLMKQEFAVLRGHLTRDALHGILANLQLLLLMVNDMKRELKAPTIKEKISKALYRYVKAILRQHQRLLHEAYQMALNAKGQLTQDDFLVFIDFYRQHINDIMQFYNRQQCIFYAWRRQLKNGAGCVQADTTLPALPAIVSAEPSDTVQTQLQRAVYYMHALDLETTPAIHQSLQASRLSLRGSRSLMPFIDSDSDSDSDEEAAGDDLTPGTSDQQNDKCAVQ